MPEFHRKVDVYVDIAGRSDVLDTLAALARSDPRAFKTIKARVLTLRQLTLPEALHSNLVKRPTDRIYVLRVQSGPVSFRLPFFEVPGGKLVILTHLVSRSTLKGERYKALIEAAELRRQDWLRRNHHGGE